MKSLNMLFVLFLSLAILAPPSFAHDVGIWEIHIQEVPDTDAYRIWKGSDFQVVDGDTIRLANGTLVRLVGYDAYELNEPRGPKAREALDNLTKDMCYLDIDDLEPLDTYGRKLGYLWCRAWLLLVDPPVFPLAALSPFVNIAKWFLTSGSDYVKGTVYIPPDEHPWWTWLTRHSVNFIGFYPKGEVILYNPTANNPYQRNEYIFSDSYTLYLLSGRYEFRIAYFAFNMTFGVVEWVDLITDESETVFIDANEVSFYTLFVRGSDNRIYYAVCGDKGCAHITNPATWLRETHIRLPGSTIDAPAATEVLIPYGDGFLTALAVRGGGNSIWFGYLYAPSLATGRVFFSGWQRVSGSTPSRPALTTDGNNIYMVVRGSDNRIYFNVYAGGRWLGWRRLPVGSTVDAPASAYLNGSLHIVVRGSDGHSLWHSWVDLSAGSFRGWYRIPGSTPSAPYLTSDGKRLYLAVRGRDNRIYYNVYNGERWEGWVRVPTGSTVTTPTMLVDLNVIHFLVVGMDGKSIYYASRDLVTGEYTAWTLMPGSTRSPVAGTLLRLRRA